MDKQVMYPKRTGQHHPRVNTKANINTPVFPATYFYIRRNSGWMKLPGIIKTAKPVKSHGAMAESRTLLSLFDYSGEWSKPFADAGWIVHQWDIKLSEFMDINLIDSASTALELFESVNGIIAAPPCTDFAASGAHTWKFKDEDGRTHKSVELVKQVIRLVDLFEPTDPDYDDVWFWAVENPVGRMGNLTGLGKPFYFNPCEFSGWLNPSKRDLLELERLREKSKHTNITKKEGDFVMELEAYTKKTGLWGQFAKPEKKPLSPIYLKSSKGIRFSPVAWFTGGKGDKTKEIRSNTPYGFALAFYEANREFRAQFEPGYWERLGWSKEEAKEFYDNYHANKFTAGDQIKLFSGGGSVNRPVELKLIDKAPLPIPSASSIECLNGKLYIVGDDSPNLSISNTDLTEQKNIRLYPGENRIPKLKKSDLEASAIVNWGNYQEPNYHLLITGSASLPGREIVIDAPVNELEKHVKYDASVFFGRVRQTIPNLNIEGMSSLAGLCIVLASRGNRSNPQNHLIFTERDFYKKQEKATIITSRLNLPHNLGISGLCYLANRGILLITASSEDSPDAIQDGVIGDSYFGWIKNFSQKIGNEVIEPDLLLNLAETDKRFKGEKIESVCAENIVENQDEKYILHFVSDNDNGSSNIFKATVNLPSLYDGAVDFATGGSMLLAPNGKPSNLTPEQYRLVRTPEFKAWFGDWEKLARVKFEDSGIDEITLGHLSKDVSKVVDENGEPLVVYHGTRNNFNVFDIDKAGESSTLAKVGFWFTPKKTFAENFSANAYWGKDGYFAYPTFLNFKNPKIYVGGGSGNFVDSYEKFRTDIYKIEGKSEFDANIAGIGKALKNAKQTINHYREMLKGQNYDGIIIVNTSYDRRMAGGNNDQYIALQSNQIKLADGTNTTFDGANPDIRFADGGAMLLAPNGKPSNLTPEQYRLVRTPEFKAWFGDWENSPEKASKVVDENGEPLVVFHGTAKQFSVFEKQKGNNFYSNISVATLGFYFTNCRDYKSCGIYGGNALEYANNALMYRKSDETAAAIVMECFLSIKHPLTFQTTTPDESAVGLMDFQERTIRGNYQYYQSYDGFISIDIHSEMLNGQPEKVFVVKSPNQIKLADGTNITFDGTSPDVRFADGGAMLLAPNGKPSNLTPEQYRLVRTPDFKSWFGDWENSPEKASKVVDENGEPLVVYHGTTSDDFSIFKYGQFGFHFGTKEQAEKIVSIRAGRQRIRPYFLFLNNPLHTIDFPRWEWYIVSKILHKHGVLNEKEFALITKNKKGQQEDILKNILREKGYDGFMYNNEFEGKGNSFIAWQPNQIKLADGTNTTFDGANPDVRFADGGAMLASNESIKLYQVYILENDEPVKVLQTYDFDEANRTLEIQRKLGKRGAHIQYAFNYSAGGQVGDKLTWVEFRNMLLKDTEIRDSFGKVEDEEKKQWAAASDYWVLSVVDPVTLKPLPNEKKAYGKPIIIDSNGDILDGKHRQMRAINDGVYKIWAWVASDRFAGGGQLELFEQIKPYNEEEIDQVPEDNFRGTPEQVTKLRLENPNPQLTMFSFGGGQDSWCILYKLIHDKEFRQKYAPNDLVIAMSDTGNEFPYTYKYLKEAIALGQKNGIHFQFITPDQGFHTEGWPNLKHNLKKNDNVLSATMQRQPCTINLKINVVDKYMHHYMMQKYFPDVEVKNKSGWKLYKEKFGTKARVLIGFAKDEEARVIKSHRMHKALDKDGKPLLPRWKMDSIQYCYPLIEEGWNRASAQEIILNYREDLPPPSNCMICFYQSDQEILWLERNYPTEFYDWVEMEKRKLEKFSHKEKNYGVYGTITLLQKLEMAKEKYGHWTDEQLWEYKMSHGHCVKSVY